MQIEPTEFLERLKESSAGRAITKQYSDSIAAGRQKVIAATDEARKRAEVSIRAARAKIPAADAALAVAEKALREAQNRRLSLEAEATEASAAAEAVERRSRKELLETAPECIGRFMAEAQARSEALRLEPPNTVESGGWSQRVLGAANIVHTDYASRCELIRECLAVYHEAEALKLTAATEEEALEAIKKLRARIMRDLELRQVAPQPERAA